MSTAPLGGHVEVYRDSADEIRWRRRAANGQVIATSGEGYKNRVDALDMIARQYPDIEIVEIEEPDAEPAA